MRRALPLVLLLLALVGLVLLLVPPRPPDAPREATAAAPHARPAPALRGARPPTSTPEAPAAAAATTVVRTQAPPPDARVSSVRTQGRVVDAAGAPVPWARVFWRRRWPRGPYETDRADAEGRFVLPWMARGTPLIVHAAADATSFPLERTDIAGLASAGDRNVRCVAAPGETLVVEVPLLTEPGFGWGTVHGEIPVQAVMVRRETHVRLATVLDAQGRATFGGVPEDGCECVVHVGPDGTGRCARATWTGAGGTLRLTWERAGTIQGRLAGHPQPTAARVDVQDGLGFVFHGHGESDGAFTVEGLHPAILCRAMARIIGHFHVTPWVRCRPGDRDLLLTFPPR